jgi:hypothetical protein
MREKKNYIYTYKSTIFIGFAPNGSRVFERSVVHNIKG